jgi:hypothetical protein
VVEDVLGVHNAYIASPSTPSDEYMKRIIECEQVMGSGTFLLGFDLE